MGTIYRAPEELIPGKETFTELVGWRLAETPDRPAFRYRGANDEWVSLTWKEEGDEVEIWAAGLIALGIELEERVAIASETRMEWITACLAIARAGAACTTVYASTGAEDVAYILSDSNSKILFAENQAQVDKVLEQKANVPELTKIVLFEGDGDGDFVISMNDFRALGKEALAKNAGLVSERADQVKPEHLATLIYTSGTTGKPKGVELLQSCWGYVGKAVPSTGVMDIDDVQFLWLPMAHVFGTVLIVAAVQMGFETAVDGRVPKIMENIGQIKPSFMGAVPRIFEKVSAGIQAMAKAAGQDKADALASALEIGKRYMDAKQAGGEIDPKLQEEFDFVDAVALVKLREALGGNIKFFISGSAPLSAEVADFFNCSGMPILEGYGLTETAAVATVGRPATLRAGTVGEPQPGAELTIADDGEVLVRGPMIMRGYRNRPEATEEVFVGDGWFATGDIGEFDDQGRLKITDRKKDLFKTSGGKYIAPSNIESQFKAICGLASNIVVHANNRKFVSAIVTLDPDAAAMWANARSKPTDLASLSKDPEMLQTIQDSITELNGRLNHWENVQKFILLPRDFTVDEGELTPSLKVKRKVIEERNKDALDALYA